MIDKYNEKTTYCWSPARFRQELNELEQQLEAEATAKVEAWRANDKLEQQLASLELDAKVRSEYVTQLEFERNNLECSNRAKEMLCNKFKQKLAEMREAARDFYDSPSVMNEEALIIALQGGEKDD